MKKIIDCKNISKTFDNKEYILNDFNLEIEEGTITIIVGKSGSGKTTLLRLFLGLTSLTDGSIRVLGKDLSSLNQTELKSLRSKFSVLFQNTALFDHMTVIENVIFPLKEAGIKDNLFEIASGKLQSLDIHPNLFKKLPSQISGGQSKRVGLARALVRNPKILFYDEPTTGLDPETLSLVNDLIVKTHTKNSGLSSVIVSHDLSSSLLIADKLIMIGKGKVLLHDTPSEFKKSKIPEVRRFLDARYEES